MADVPGITPEFAAHLASYIHPDKLLGHEASASERQHWLTGGGPALQTDVTVTLTSHQWAAIGAMIQIAAAISDKPGFMAMAWQDLARQVRQQAPGAFGPNSPYGRQPSTEE